MFLWKNEVHVPCRLQNNCLKTHADDPFVELDMLFQGAKTLVVAGSPRAWLSFSDGATAEHMVPFLSSFLMPIRQLDWQLRTWLIPTLKSRWLGVSDEPFNTRIVLTFVFPHFGQFSGWWVRYKLFENTPMRILVLWLGPAGLYNFSINFSSEPTNGLVAQRGCGVSTCTHQMNVVSMMVSFWGWKWGQNQPMIWLGFLSSTRANDSQVVKNSSKVGLGDVDLMKCMFGGSVEIWDRARWCNWELSENHEMERTIKNLLRCFIQYSSKLRSQLMEASREHLAIMSWSFLQMWGPPPQHLRSATFDFSTDDWHLLSLHGGWANERHINTRRHAPAAKPASGT